MSTSVKKQARKMQVDSSNEEEKIVKKLCKRNDSNNFGEGVSHKQDDADSHDESLSQSEEKRPESASYNKVDKVSMTNTVLSIMHSFGDGNNSGNLQNKQSAELVERFVLIDTVNILRCASMIAADTQMGRVRFEEVLMALAENDEQVMRLMHYANFQKLQRYVNTIDGDDDELDSDRSRKCNTLVEKCRSCLIKLGKAEMVAYLGSFTKTPKDPVRQRHLQRHNLLSMFMSEEDWKQFVTDRKVSFINCHEKDGNTETFHKWLYTGALRLGIALLPCTSSALGALAYLASGNIARFIDVITDMRRDRGKKPTATTSEDSSKQFLQTFQQLLDSTAEAKDSTQPFSLEESDRMECVLYNTQAALPSEVVEAINRHLVTPSTKWQECK